MSKFITKLPEYDKLQKELKVKTKKLALNSPEIVKISQKLDKIVLLDMKN
ncbi:MAG: Spo0E family sporulation regulatory protein-aspartic acid phosphatase [Halanaerobiales bacterium]|nr:Spo0E family sporulation regulatory protein-aspartic acid phosphatase [Halanaerobiales bacterium]